MAKKPDRCSTRERLRECNILPKSGMPNVCATCEGNRLPEDCFVVIELETAEKKSKENDWDDSDSIYAY